MLNHIATRPWRWVAAVAILGNIFINFYANQYPFNGQSMAVVSARYATPLTPAGYAFSIWGVIFLGLAAYALWQLLPAQTNVVLPDRIAKPLMLVNIFTASWIAAFSHEWIALSVLLMLLILLGLMLIYGQAREAVLTKEIPGWVSAPFALYLGWISVASVINLTIGLQQLGLQMGPAISVDVAYVVVVLLVGVVVAVAAVFQDLAFLLAPVWGLVGIWAAQVRDEPSFGWTALAAAVLTALLGFARVRQRAKRQPWEVAGEAAAAEVARLRAEAETRASQPAH